MGRKKGSRGGPPEGLGPGPERQRARSRETLGRARRRAVEPEPEGPPSTVSRVGLIETQPFVLMAYWSAAPPALSAARRRVGDPEAVLTLRFREVSLASSGAGEDSFDVPVEGLRGSRFVRIEKTFRLLRSELGARGRDGRFSTLARSNVVQTPRDRESERYEERFRRLSERRVPPPTDSSPDPRANPGDGRAEARTLPPMGEDIRRVYKEFPPRFPAGLPPSSFPPAPPPGREGSPRSSSPGGTNRPPPPIVPAPSNPSAKEGPFSVSNQFHLEVDPWPADLPDAPPAAGGPPPGGGEAPGGGPGPGGSGGPSSVPTSPGGASAAAIRSGEAVDLELHADVVIYGRARPGTKVYLSGAELMVKGDGTFEARFALPSAGEHGQLNGGGPHSGRDR